MSQMSTGERLVYMANQIARNFATAGEDRAAHATADHIIAFWDPRMKERILAFLASGEEGLSPIAHAAIGLLPRGNALPSQTPATEFNAVHEAGRSDAG